LAGQTKVLSAKAGVAAAVSHETTSFSATAHPTEASFQALVIPEAARQPAPGLHDAKGMVGNILLEQESLGLKSVEELPYPFSCTNDKFSFPEKFPNMAQKVAQEEGNLGTIVSSHVPRESEMSPYQSTVSIKGGVVTDTSKEQENPLNMCNIMITENCEHTFLIPSSSAVSESNIGNTTMKNAKNNGTGVYLGGRYTSEDILAFGGISAREMDVRSSERIRCQPNADAPQMERAQLLTQARKEGSLTGTQSFSKFSLNSLSNDTVINRAARLGVSLGVSPEQISNSINIIKEKDNMRTVVMLAKNLKEKSAEEDQHSILDQATNLSVDLVGEEQLGSEESSAFFVKPKITKVYKRKQKVIPIAVRRSARLSKK
jgi:hypothetical protein